MRFIGRKSAAISKGFYLCVSVKLQRCQPFKVEIQITIQLNTDSGLKNKTKYVAVPDFGFKLQNTIRKLHCV